MNGNKLKHNFVKKEKQLEEETVQEEASRYTHTYRGGVNVNYEQPPEVSPVEEVIVERVLTPEILLTYRDQREELINTIKKDMAKELGSLLLESGYVIAVESIIPDRDYNTKIKMMIKAKKLIQ